MIRRTGLIGAWNYTYGPALVYEGKKSLDYIQRSGEPVVIVAASLPIHELLRVDIRRIRGFVLEKLDNEGIMGIFLAQEKRAAVYNIPNVMADCETGTWVIVDGVNGEVYFDPDEETVNRYYELRCAGAPLITKEHLPRLVKQVVRSLPRPEPPKVPEGMDIPKETLDHMPTDVEVPPEALMNSVIAKLSPFVGRAFEEDEKEVIKEAIAAEQAVIKEELKAAAEAAGADDARAAKRADAKARVEQRRADARKERDEAKADAKPDAKADAKPDAAKADAKPEAKPDAAKVETKAAEAAKPEPAKAEAKPEAKPEARTEVKEVERKRPGR